MVKEDMDRSGIIYLITNTVNGKVYVGKTTKTAEQRWRQHCDNARRFPESRIHLHMAIRRHGVEVFSVQVLERCPTEKLSLLERKHIGERSSTDRHIGYNLNPGGGGGAKIGNANRLGSRLSADHRKAISEANRHPKSAETITRMKKAHAGKTFSAEQRRNMSIAATGRSHGPMSDETKRKLSVAHKGKLFTDSHRKAIGLSKKGIVMAVEQRLKISASVKLAWDRRRHAS